MKTDPPRRRRRKGKIIALCALGALLAGVVVLLVFYWPVFALVFSPNKIALRERDESLAILQQLADDGQVRFLPAERDTIAFANADGSVSVAVEYSGQRAERIAGEIDAARVGVETIGQAKDLARVMLSPYLGESETAALLLRYSPSIIAGVGGDVIDMTLDIGGNYTVNVWGSPQTFVQFSIAVNPAVP